MGTWKTLLLGAAAGGTAASLWFMLQRQREKALAPVPHATADPHVRRRAAAPDPPSGSSTNAEVNAVLSVLSHAATLDSDALANDTRCGGDVAALHSLAMHVAAIAAGDALVLGSGGAAANDRVTRALTALVTGGCRTGATANASSPPVSSLVLGGVRAPRLLEMTTAPDVAKVLIEDGRPVDAVSPLARLVARALASMLVDGSAGACPVSTEEQDAISAAIVTALDRVVVAAGRRASSAAAGSGEEPHRDILCAVDAVCALLLAPIGTLEGHLRAYVVGTPTAGVNTKDDAGATKPDTPALKSVLAVASMAPPDALEGSSSRPASAASPHDPTADRRSELQRIMIRWVERFRTAALRALLAHDWVRASLAADTGKSAAGSYALVHLHVAASAVSSPDAAASGDEPLRRLLDLLRVAKEPLAVLRPDGSVAPVPSSDALFAKRPSAAAATGDNLLHALLRPLSVRAASVANAARAGSLSRSQAQQSAAAFDVVAAHVQLAVGFVLGRCSDTASSVSGLPSSSSAGTDGRAPSSSAAESEHESSTVFVADHDPAASVGGPTTTQRWLQVGEGPDARRRVAVGLVDKDGLTPYLMADRAMRLLRSTEALPAAMAARVESICGALSVSDYDVV